MPMVGRQKYPSERIGERCMAAIMIHFDYRIVFRLMKEFVWSICAVQDLVNPCAQDDTCSSGHRGTLYRWAPFSQEKVCVPFIAPLRGCGKRIEELFGEAKECMGLRRMKFRRALFVREQVPLTAAAQNIKRMVRPLSRMGPKMEAESQALSPMTVLPSLFDVLIQRILPPYDEDQRTLLSAIKFFNSL